MRPSHDDYVTIGYAGASKDLAVLPKFFQIYNKSLRLGWDTPDQIRTGVAGSKVLHD
jgi:hypothetical protein